MAAATDERQVPTMRKLILALAVLTALAVAGPAGAATKTVSIYGSTFSPRTLTITEGDTVTWVNRDNANHQVLAKKGQFVSAILHPKQTFSFTFRAAGNYAYEDELHPKLTGTIVVKGAPPTLTLGASTGFITYGDQAMLSGTVSNHRAGEAVVIYYQPYPQPSPIQRATVLTGVGGTYSFLISPQIVTTYQASWKGAFSLPTSVQVQPKLVLGRHNGWLVHVYGGRSFAGRAVQFQRFNAATGAWVTLKKVVLGTSSSSRFAFRLPKGMNQIRLALSVNQAGAGYLGVIGKPINWRNA
jgi:plastocyanin